MNWKHGYFADSGYTYGFYPETMPWRLHWAAMLQDHRTNLQGFRYLDAGCGQGYNLIIAAICHPDSEFVGIDFLPEHIAHARGLAERCGVRNVRFIEGDFIRLAEDPTSLGEFDYAVCHGIATWVAPVVRNALFKLIGQVLKPGGVFYNSYNTLPGWLSMIPFQHLVLLEQKTKSGHLAIEAATSDIERLRTLAPSIIKALPGMEARFQNMKTQDTSYLLQEYNNEFWEPLFVSQMIGDMANVKLNYLGTATLPECFDALLPKELKEWLFTQESVTMREQLRDYALNQSFRRDLYVKGGNKFWQHEKSKVMHETRFVFNPMMKLPEEGAPFEIKGGILTISGKPEIYLPLLKFVKDAGAAGVSITELMARSTDPAERLSVQSTVTLMVHSNYLMPITNAGVPSRQVTAKLTEAVLAGAPYKYLPLPTVGTAVTMGEVDWVLMHLSLTDVPSDQWNKALPEFLKQLGRNLLKDGAPIFDAATQTQIVDGLIKIWVDVKEPFFKAVKAI
ncbi:class I SAM-dependent methyltransferase [Undibacterium sp. Ji22W]|uniref:class I SAM-dependent methyltransferase n=1 Tax=Undibacterium sp. Ji22W TaxID=3413038 RepID=UPI003BF41C2E